MAGTSAFISSYDRDLGLFIKVQRGSQALSGVEAWNSAFLLSSLRGVRAPVQFRQGIWAFSRGSAWETGLPSCCEGILEVPLEPVQGNQDLSRAEGELSVLFPCSKIHWIPLEIQLVTPASYCGARRSWDSS